MIKVNQHHSFNIQKAFDCFCGGQTETNTILINVKHTTCFRKGSKYGKIVMPPGTFWVNKGYKSLVQ